MESLIGQHVEIETYISSSLAKTIPRFHWKYEIDSARLSVFLESKIYGYLNFVSF